MSLEMLLTLAALGGVLVVLLLELVAADVALLAALGLVVVGGVLPVEDALSGFASPTLLTLGSLYIVAAALRETGALARASRMLLGSVQARWRLVLRVVAPVSIASAFLNNTPIVAMGIPAIQTWCRRNDLSPSRLLIPLSYASILGGMCTLLGTSTNLVAHGMLQDEGLRGLGFFELSWVGVPCVLLGWAYLIGIAPRLLGDRAEPDPDTPDRPDEEEAPEPPLHDREAHTVAVAEGSRLVGQQVEDARIFERFNAVVVEVRREGEQVGGEISDITLRSGDTLVLDTGLGFRRAFEDTSEFVVTSAYEDDEDEGDPRGGPRIRAMIATSVVLVAIVGLSATGSVPISVAAVLGAVGLILGRVVPAAKAREAIDFQVLIVIGAALGLGEAMQASGTAGRIADVLVQAGSVAGPIGLLAALILGTSVLTQLITNNGAVALFFPVALSVAESMQVDPRPLVIGLTVAGSMAFLTPLGYQTNLMVYSAGDHRFTDFIKVGGPLQLGLMILAVLLIPWVWPF